MLELRPRRVADASDVVRRKRGTGTSQPENAEERKPAHEAICREKRERKREKNDGGPLVGRMGGPAAACNFPGLHSGAPHIMRGFAKTFFCCVLALMNLALALK